jgi:hypothetical protein
MINFMEFVCTLWNLLTLPESDYGALAFLIKDPTAAGTINYGHVRQLMEMMHCKKVDRDPALSAVYLRMRKELGNSFTIHEFNKWTATNPHVVTPIMMLQLHIRLQIIGEPFWAKLAVQRKEHPEQGQLDYVKKLQHAVIDKNEAFKERLAIEKAEQRRLARRGLGKMGDYRDNVTRKQSVLLSYFNLKSSDNKQRLGRQGKSLSRVIVLDDDGDDDDDIIIAGGQSASGRRRNPGSSNKVAAVDPFMEFDIRAKPSVPSSSSGVETSSIQNTIVPSTIANNDSKPKKVKTIVDARGDNRRRRSSLTLQKPNLVRDAADNRKKKENKYKQVIKAYRRAKMNEKGDNGSKKKNKSKGAVEPVVDDENEKSSDSEEEIYYTGA